MRRELLAPLGATPLLLLVPGMQATAPVDGGPDRNGVQVTAVAGVADHPSDAEPVWIAAFRQADGSVSGRFSVAEKGEFYVRGHILCYEVVTANITKLGGRIDRATGTDPRLRDNKYFVFYLQDNGGPTTDVIGTGFHPVPPRDCGSIVQGGGTPFFAGDVVIHN